MDIYAFKNIASRESWRKTFRVSHKARAKLEQKSGRESIDWCKDVEALRLAGVM